MKKKFIFISITVSICILGIFVFAKGDEIGKNFKKGIEYTNQGEYDKAIKEFTKVITNDKDYANAYLALGIVYINKKMDKEAVMLLKKAIELDPNNKKSYFILASWSINSFRFSRCSRNTVKNSSN